jgi:ribonuclease P protein component
MATLKKQERLKSSKLIDRLFKDGKSFGIYPLRLVWLETDLPQAGVWVQTGFTVPKRRFAKATARNRIKRKVREAYRLKKTAAGSPAERSETPLCFYDPLHGKRRSSLRSDRRRYEWIIKAFYQKRISQINNPQ